MEEKVEISVKEYVELRKTINWLQTENHLLHAVVDSIALALENSGLVGDSQYD